LDYQFTYFKNVIIFIVLALSCFRGGAYADFNRGYDGGQVGLT
jgi:hypothetical protein